MALFGSNRGCELLILIKIVKTSYRNRLNDTHSSSLVKVGIANTFKPMIENLLSKERCQAYLPRVYQSENLAKSTLQ